MAITIGCVARGVGPIMFSNLFAKTAQSGLPFPFNFACSYETLALVLLSSYTIFSKMPKSLNDAKEAETQHFELT